MKPLGGRLLSCGSIVNRPFGRRCPRTAATGNGRAGPASVSRAEGIFASLRAVRGMICDVGPKAGNSDYRNSVHMVRRSLICILAVALTTGTAFGDGLTVVGTGYSGRGGIQVAPGQVTTFLVTGLTIDPTQPQQASSLPLPTHLAGISLTISQSSPEQSLPVPLLAVTQTGTCSNAQSPPSLDCLVTMITAQIPFELVPPSYGNPPTGAEVVVTANGAPSEAFTLQVVLDSMHVLTTCDLTQSSQSSNPSGSGGSCSSIVAHADGTLVTIDSPAVPGEEVVIYAFGLGQTIPAVKTGEATPSVAPVLGYYSEVSSLIVQFDFRPNAGPSRPYYGIQGGPSPTFVGLTPGEVGLYQVNIVLPDSFPQTPPCNLIKSPQAWDVAFSNLTINLEGPNSMDGAAICVKVSN